MFQQIFSTHRQYTYTVHIDSTQYTVHNTQECKTKTVSQIMLPQHFGEVLYGDLRLVTDVVEGVVHLSHSTTDDAEHEGSK